MDVGQWVLLGFFCWLGWRMLKGMDSSKNKPMFCTACGHEGECETKTRGSMAIEIVLWLCFIIPGLIYSLWRQGSRTPVCASRGSTALVPPDSPMANATRRALNAK